MGREGGREEGTGRQEEGSDGKEAAVVVPALSHDGRPLVGAGGAEADMRREDLRRGGRKGKTKVRGEGGKEGGLAILFEAFFCFLLC
jgi:hypothetical protein